MRRDLSGVIVVIAVPVIFLLLFVYVFGNALGAGIEVKGTSGYLADVVPGVLIIGIAAGAKGTSVSVSTDMTEGIIARFRTMAISRGAVLTGHVGGAVTQTLLGMAGVIAISLLLGYRPDADVADWFGTIGVLALIAFALSWLAVAIGTFANTTTIASNLPVPLVLLPFLGSGFVSAESMPGENILVTAIWCGGTALVGYAWAVSQYNWTSVR